jgi:hypothetical protein
VSDLEESYQIREAQHDLAAQIREVERLVLTEIRELTDLERQRGEANRELADAETALAEARALETYSEESSQMMSLERQAAAAWNTVRLIQARLQLSLESLSRSTGLTVTEIPAELPNVELSLPGVGDARDNPSVELAELALRLERARLEEHQTSGVPDLSATGSFRRTIEEKLSGEQTTTEASGALEIGFEEVQISAGVGGITETETLYFAAELAWTPGNRKVDRLETEDLDAVVRIKEEEMDKAYQDYLEDRDALGIEILELDHRSTELNLDTEEASAWAAETRARHASGLADDDELEDARWGLEETTYQRRLLAIDRLITETEIRDLVAGRMEVDS